MISGVMKFLEDNFFYLHPGYTPLNTLVFGLTVGLIVLIIMKMFRWLDKDPGDLFAPLIPFIFLGSCARALVDNGVYPLTHLLVTPGIYILVGLAAILTLIASVKVEEKFGWDYRRTIFTAGTILSIPNIISIPGINPAPFLTVTGVWLLFSTMFRALSIKCGFLREDFNLPVLYAHIFDASSTFVAVDLYGYTEQHVLPSALTGITGTALVMFPLKIAVIMTALYIIDAYVPERRDASTLKLVIFILGLAPGLRNFLSLSMSV